MENIIKTAGVLVLSGNKVLLVRHREKAGHLTGTFGIPAGRLEQGESSIEAAMRELLEETGLKTTASDLSQVPETYTATLERKDGTKAFYLETFLCNSWEGELKGSDETSPEWIDTSKMNELKLLPNVQKMVTDALKHK